MDKRTWIQTMNTMRSMSALHKRHNDDNLVRNINDKSAIQMIWVSSNDETQKYQDKSALALTLVRASYVHVPSKFCVDLQQWCAQHNIQTELNGYVHLDPQTNGALNIVIGKVHWHEGSIGTTQDAFLLKLEQLEQQLKSHSTTNGSPLVSPNTYINIAQYDSARVFQTHNVLADVLDVLPTIDKGNQILADAKHTQAMLLKEYGMSLMRKRIKDMGWRPGFAQIAYIAADSTSTHPADHAALNVPAHSLLGIPTENVQADSTGKNVREMEDPMSDWSKNNRIDFLNGFFENWLMRKKIQAGLEDAAICQKAGELHHQVESQRMEELRQIGIRTLETHFGQAKQLSYSVFNTSIFNTKDAKQPFTVLVAPDMSIADGQHSTRDMGLVIWALEHKSTPIYNERDIKDLHWELITRQFQSFFQKEATQWYEAQQMQDAPQQDKQSVSPTKDQMMILFARTLGSEHSSVSDTLSTLLEDAAATLTKTVSAQVNLNPNALARQAQARTKQTNRQRTVSEEALFQNDFEKAIQAICTRFSKVSKHFKRSERLYWNKHPGLNPGISTSERLNVSFADLVPYIEIIQKRKNLKSPFVEGAEKIVQQWVTEGKLSSKDAPTLSVRLAALGEVLTNFKTSGRIGLSAKRLSSLFESHVKAGLSLDPEMHAVLKKYGSLKDVKKVADSFDKLVQREAQALGAKPPKDISPYDLELFVIISQAMKLRSIVENYASSLSHGARAVFDNKTSYFNHIFGLLQGTQMATPSSQGNPMLDPAFAQNLETMLQQWTDNGDAFLGKKCVKNNMIKEFSDTFSKIKAQLREDYSSFGRDDKIEKKAYEDTLLHMAKTDPYTLLYLAHYTPAGSHRPEPIFFKDLPQNRLQQTNT